MRRNRTRGVNRRILLETESKDYKKMNQIMKKFGFRKTQREGVYESDLKVCSSFGLKIFLQKIDMTAINPDEKDVVYTLMSLTHKKGFEEGGKSIQNGIKTILGIDED
jgi:hypothetical protein